VSFRDRNRIEFVVAHSFRKISLEKDFKAKLYFYFELFREKEFFMLKIRRLSKLQCFSNKRCFGSTTESYQNNLAYIFEKHTKGLKMPYFTARSGNIEILKDPIDFYVALHVRTQMILI